MGRRLGVSALLVVACCSMAVSQTFPSDDPVIRKIWTEAMDSTQLPPLAHELFDVIGPRLAYLASEDPEFISRERRAMPMEKSAGKLQEWPPVKEPKREGGMNTQ